MGKNRKQNNGFIPPYQFVNLQNPTQSYGVPQEVMQQFQQQYVPHVNFQQSVPQYSNVPQLQGNQYSNIPPQMIPQLQGNQYSNIPQWGQKKKKEKPIESHFSPAQRMSLLRNNQIDPTFNDFQQQIQQVQGPPPPMMPPSGYGGYPLQATVPPELLQQYYQQQQSYGPPPWMNSGKKHRRH